MTLIDRNPKSARAQFERLVLAIVGAAVFLAVLLTARLAFAQDTATPAPSWFATHLPELGGGVLATLLALLGGLKWLTDYRKRVIANIVHGAFFVVEDAASQDSSENGIDKLAVALKTIDEALARAGWRPLKPKEVEDAKMQLAAQHGAQVAAAKVVATALAAATPAVQPSSP